jgi:hypothetical protein
VVKEVEFVRRALRVLRVTQRLDVQAMLVGASVAAARKTLDQTAQLAATVAGLQARLLDLEADRAIAEEEVSDAP